MKESLVIGALIFLVVAIVRAVGTAIAGTEPPFLEVMLQAFVTTVVLTPLIQWVRPGQVVSQSPSDPLPEPSHPTIDPISNTLNMRGLTINLLETMAIAERYDRELAVVMMSMDDTDDVHERYGDGGVESALQMMGDTTTETLRVPDRAGRYEGDTFLLILPETDIEGARLIAERVRRQIVDTSVKATRGQQFSVSASAGVAVFNSGDDPQLLVGRAQSALADARRLGQNRTVVYSG